MPEAIVEFFEIVDVYHDGRIFFSCRSKTPEPCIERAPIAQFRKPVDLCLAVHDEHYQNQNEENRKIEKQPARKALFCILTLVRKTQCFDCPREFFVRETRVLLEEHLRKHIGVTRKFIEQLLALIRHRDGKGKHQLFCERRFFHDVIEF